MIIEAGNWYRTKNGLDAFVGFLLPKISGDHNVVGYINNSYKTERWNEEGSLYNSNYYHNKYDLIELLGKEYQPPELIIKENNYYVTCDNNVAYIIKILDKDKFKTQLNEQIIGLIRYKSGRLSYKSWQYNGKTENFSEEPNDLLYCLGEEYDN